MKDQTFMGGIAGILHFDQAPVEERQLRAMAQAMAYRGQDGMDVWRAGGVGFAHCHFWTTPEDVGERQPIAAQDGHCWIAADARIDNRDEVIPYLRSRGFLSKDVPTNAELLMAAYDCWGPACGAKLTGAFAFALWDVREHRLLLVRDLFGIGQIYYRVQRDALYFATTIGGVLAAPADRPPLNEPLVRDFLRGRFTRFERETVYAGLVRLPPGHYLLAQPQGVRLARYDVLGSQPPPAYASDRDWIAALRERFDRALLAQARGPTRTTVLVSGGLDSSAMACALHDLRGSHALPPVELLSSVYDQTPSADEREYFFAVAASCPGFSARTYASDDEWGFRDFRVESGYPLDEPDIYALRAHTMGLFGAVAASGSRVALSGDWANFVFGDAVYATPEALRGVAPNCLLRELPHYRRRCKMTWPGLLFRAYTPQPLRRLVHAGVNPVREALRPPPPVAPWVREGLDPPNGPAASTEVGRLNSPDGLSHSGRLVYRWLTRPYDFARLSAIDVSAAFAGMEWRLPYLDRRVVELALRMPQHLACSGGLNRVILREAVRGSLPERVRVRMDKPGLPDLIRRGFDRERSTIEYLLAEPMAEKLGFIDSAALYEHVISTWPAEGTIDFRFQSSIPSLCLEAWLRYTCRREDSCLAS